MQHSFPLDDQERGGLLPDIFVLSEQQRDGPAINPGTVQSGAMEFYGGSAFYQFRALHKTGLLIHAPATIQVIEESPDHAFFRIESWLPGPFHILIHARSGIPRVLLDTHLTGSLDRIGSSSIVLHLDGSQNIRVEMDPR